MVALFMPQMWVAFAHVVSLKFRSCSTVKRSCFQMWLLDIPWRVLYKSLLPGPNLQRFWFRGLTQGPGSCIESQPIYIYIFFFQSFVGILIAHLGTTGMRYGMSGSQLCICTWVVQRNVCLFCVECIQQRCPHGAFYEKDQFLISCCPHCQVGSSMGTDDEILLVVCKAWVWGQKPCFQAGRYHLVAVWPRASHFLSLLWLCEALTLEVLDRERSRGTCWPGNRELV